MTSGALLGRIELVHTLLTAARRLTGTEWSCLWHGGVAHGLGARSLELADAARRAAADGELVERLGDALVIAVPLPERAGGLAVGAATEEAAQPRRIALLGRLASQGGAELVGWPTDRPFWDGLVEPEGSAEGARAWLDRHGRVEEGSPAARSLLEALAEAHSATARSLVDALADERRGGNEGGSGTARSLVDPLAGEPLGGTAALAGDVLGGDDAVSARSERATALAVPSAQRRLAVLFETAAWQAVRRLEAEIVDDAAHELRTPLTALRAHAEILPDLLADADATARQFLGVIDSEAQRMGAMLDDLRAALTFERTVVVHR